MKKLLTIIPLVILLCFTFSCQKQGEEVAEEPVVDVEAEKAKVKSVLDKYIEAWKNEDLEIFSKIFAPDEDIVIFLADSPELFIGWETWKEKIQSYFEPIENIDVSFRDEFIKVHSSGDMAWLSCIEDANYVYKGEPVRVKGGRVTWVMEKRNGNWVIVHAHWSVPSEL